MTRILLIILFVICITNPIKASQDVLNIDNDHSVYKLPSEWSFIPDEACKTCPVIDPQKKDPLVSIDSPQPWLDNKLIIDEKSGWYYTNFSVKNISEYFLLFPLAKRGLQIFLNGTVIAETQPFDKNGISPPIITKPQVIIIPREKLKQDINVLSIKTAALDAWGGFMNNDLFIGSPKKILSVWLFTIIRFSSQIVIMLFLSLYFLFFYLKIKSDRYYLFFSIQSCAFACWILGYTGFGQYLYDSHLTFILLTYVGGFIGYYSYVEFIQSFFNYKTKFGNLIAVIYILLFFSLFVELIIHDRITYFNLHIYQVFIYSIIFINGYLLFLVYKAVKLKKEYSYHFAIVQFIFSSFLIYHSLIFLSILHTPQLGGESYLIIIILFSWILASRYSKVHTELETAHSDLLVLDRMKDDFLATTTHELRTPLHGIMGIAESMETGALGNLNARQRENLELIRTSAARLNGLVGSILDFSKLRAGRADLFIEEVSIGDLAASALSLLRPQAQEKGLELRSEIGPLPSIKADRNRIYQIIFNLAGNAIKFTDAGSVVLRATAGDGSVRVCVADTGPGIATEDLPRIWSPFTQAEHAETRHTVGTGLGLAITKHLVELHGGRIWAESEPGRGSAFCFELPAEPPAAGIARIFPAGEGMKLPEAAAVIPAKESFAFVTASNPEKAAATILAVDDDPVNLRILENLCAEHSFKLITTAAGPAALDILGHQEIDLVLLDLMLPGMSGYEVCENIRRMEKGRYIPVIMVTALDQAGHMARGFKTGANDYVTKPFNRRELVMRIENQLTIKQMLEMEKNVVNGLRKEKDAITNMFQRSVDLKESALQMAEWEKIIREDLAIARAFQMKLMTNPGTIAGFESSVTFLPLMEIGGDVYDIFEFSPGVMRVFIADATGHGITASLNTVKILTEYATIKEVLETPAAVITFLNRRFMGSPGNNPIVFACAIADLNRKAGTVTISTAGFPNQYLLRGNAAAAVEPMNPIIGLSGKIEFRDAALPFDRGDTLFLSTDGLLEMAESRSKTAAPDGRDLIAERIARAYTGHGLAEGGSELLKLFGGKKKITEDDVTFITVRRTE